MLGPKKKRNNLRKRTIVRSIWTMKSHWWRRVEYQSMILRRMIYTKSGRPNSMLHFWQPQWTILETNKSANLDQGKGVIGPLANLVASIRREDVGPRCKHRFLKPWQQNGSYWQPHSLREKRWKQGTQPCLQQQSWETQQVFIKILLFNLEDFGGG